MIRVLVETLSTPISSSYFGPVYEVFTQSLSFHYSTRVTLVSDNPLDRGSLSVFHPEASSTDVLVIGESVTLSKVGPYYNDNLTFTFTFSVSSCEDDSDCEQCEKCLDGDCVPCDNCVDALGQIIVYRNLGLPTGSDQVVDDFPVSWLLTPHTRDLSPTSGVTQSASVRITSPKGLFGSFEVRVRIDVPLFGS